MTGFCYQLSLLSKPTGTLCLSENRRAEALMVSPTLLKVVSGEFKGLWADYLLMKASVFLGGARGKLRLKTWR